MPDVFIAMLPMTASRCVLVHRRHHAGKDFVRWRVWNFHQTKRVWYPTKRGFIVPVADAAALADAIVAGATGVEGEKPGWLIEREREEEADLLQRLGLADDAARTAAKAAAGG